MQRITAEEQDIILEDKLNIRTKYNIITQDNGGDFIKKRAVAYDLCKNDFNFFADNFVWIENPRAEDIERKNIPFLLWNYQEDSADKIIEAIEKGYDLPIEKSRDLGLSWLIIAIFVWGWNFRGWNFLVGSQKAENVHTRGNTKSLIEKAIYICERSPDWLIPPLKDKVHIKHMLLVHPDHGATIAGESNNTNFGRSDRRRAILFDEFSSWEQTDKAAWQSCSATTNCRIPLSTPNTRGTNCHFYTITHKAHKDGLPILRLHWTLHPEFSRGLYNDEYGKPRSPWYDEQCKRSSSQQEVSQELDIDYEASMGDKVYGDFKVEEQVVENLDYDDRYPLYVAWDFGLDTTAIIWIQHNYDKGTFDIIDEYSGNGNDGRGGENIRHYIEVVLNKPYKSAMHFGDPQSGEHRNMTSGTSNAAILRSYGLVFKSQKTSIRNRIAAARNVLGRVRVSDKCILTKEMFISWQFKRQVTGNTSSPLPDHSEYSHWGEAFSYWAFNFKEQNKKNKHKRTKSYRDVASSGVVL